MLEFVEEPLDQIALSIETLVEAWWLEPVWHGLDVGSGAALCEGLAQGIGVVGPVGHEHIAAADRAQHVLGAAAVMGLAFGELQQDRQAAGVDQGVDLGGQPAARTTHATGSRLFFWPLAAC